jgi:hypothetical protein
VLAALWLGGAWYFNLPAAKVPTQVARVLAAPVLARVYAHDSDHARELADAYVRNARDTNVSSATAGIAPPGFSMETRYDVEPRIVAAPFVFESPDAPYIARLRDHFHLKDVVAGATSEYDAILRLGNWVGRQFDHGTDTVVGGNHACDPVGLIEAGRSGQAYWCEIAARTMVHAATALGFTARVTTASTDGYTWEHAIAEVWSNEFRKWFVVDTDFNHVYERRGVPLSALELMQHGATWQRAGELVIRQIAPEKPNIPRGGNTIDLYKYVHVDLRNDWCSRQLPRGSPAGGDRATWWTARPDFPAVLTAKVRQDDPAMFDWPVNEVAIEPVQATAAGDRLEVVVALRTYSPQFQGFEVRLQTDGEWTPVPEGKFTAPLPLGASAITARVRTLSGFPGPASTLRVTIWKDTGTTVATTLN